MYALIKLPKKPFRPTCFFSSQIMEPPCSLPSKFGEDAKKIFFTHVIQHYQMLVLPCTDRCYSMNVWNAAPVMGGVSLLSGTEEMSIWCQAHIC